MGASFIFGRQCLALLGCVLLVQACVTRTINSDGSVQNTVIDKTKLADTYIDLAIEYQRHNAPQVALDRANLAVATAPTNPKAYMIRAMIYQQLAQDVAAENDFKQALHLDNHYPEAYVNYGVFLCAQQRYSEAEADFAMALNNPLYYTPEIGYFSRGNCYAAQANYVAATKDYLRAVNFRNPPPATYLALAHLEYQQKNYTLANSYINKFNAPQTPASIWLHLQILQALLEHETNPLKISEYTNYRNSLAELLSKSYPASPEARHYLKD